MCPRIITAHVSDMDNVLFNVALCTPGSLHSRMSLLCLGLAWPLLCFNLRRYRSQICLIFWQLESDPHLFLIPHSATFIQLWDNGQTLRSLLDDSLSVTQAPYSASFVLSESSLTTLGCRVIFKSHTISWHSSLLVEDRFSWESTVS